MRVYVATTWDALGAGADGSDRPLPGVRGVPAGTVGYALTHRLADALGAPAPMAASDEVLDEMGAVALDAAAEASLLLLAEHGAAGQDPTPRRAVLALDVDHGAVADVDHGVGAGATTGADDGPDGAGAPEHPAAVLLPRGADGSAVLSVLADDAADAGQVARALVRLAADPDDVDAAVALLEDHALGWFDPAELG